MGKYYRDRPVSLIKYMDIFLFCIYSAGEENDRTNWRVIRSIANMKMTVSGVTFQMAGATSEIQHVYFLANGEQR